ncbi:hypothetical protein RCL1_003601 [Eukaryota sp. TZLM3-RCL]
MTENVKVVCRIRPLVSYETEQQCSSITSTLSSTALRVNLSPDQYVDYNFHWVLPENATQSDVFESSELPLLLDKFLNGFSTAVLAYGQTSSGKTHTLFSPPFSSFFDIPSSDLGIVYRSLKHVFSQLSLGSSLSATFVEIYNDHVFDLLNDLKPLQLRFNSKSNCFFPIGALVCECSNLDDCHLLVQEGLSNRSVKAHSLNRDSSRSHALLTFTLKNGGKIMFADLAGSEKIKKTQSTGQILTESRFINKSLHHLGNVIHARSRESAHVGYRDCKLTSLLMDAFTGDSSVLLIGTVSPASLHKDETLSTLNYCTIAKKIKNKPVRRDTESMEINRLRSEVLTLKNRLALYENPDSSLSSLSSYVSHNKVSSFSREPSAALSISSSEESSFTPSDNEALRQQLDSMTEAVRIEKNKAMIALSELKSTVARNSRCSSHNNQKTEKDVESLRRANQHLRKTVVELQKREESYQRQLEALLERDLSDVL